jgi:hypothetical protein
MPGFILSFVSRMAGAFMAMLILVCIWIVMSGPVISALIPLAIAILAVIPLSVSVFVFVCTSIAFRRPLASVVMVPVFPFAPVFFFLGALSLSLFSGERFLKVVQAVHVGYGAEQDKHEVRCGEPMECQGSDVDGKEVTSFQRWTWNVHARSR